MKPLNLLTVFPPLIALLGLMLCAGRSLGQQPTVVRGVVTFFFNKYQGDKPDLGADVWAVDSAAAKGFDLNLADTFHYANFYRNIAASYKSMGENPPVEVIDNLATWKGDDDEYFRQLDTRMYRQFAAIKNNEDAPHTTVNASGEYSIPVNAGTYYVIIKSHNRTGLTVTEIGGKMFFGKVRVKAGQQKDVSIKFDMN